MKFVGIIQHVHQFLRSMEVSNKHKKPFFSFNLLYFWLYLVHQEIYQIDLHFRCEELVVLSVGSWQPSKDTLEEGSCPYELHETCYGPLWNE